MEMFWVLTAAALVIWLGGIVNKGFIYLSAVYIAAVMVFFALITPQQQFAGVTWEPVCAKKARFVKLADGKVELTNLRDFRYRSEHDFDPIYRSEIYDPEKLDSLDIGFSHWDGMDHVAHTLLCFNFSDGKSVALSVEMRCPQGTSREAHTTMFKQHELIYIWAPPQDLFDLRTRYRVVESLYKYRTNATKNEIKELFMRLAERTNKICDQPEFYRLIVGNCTTEWFPVLKSVRPELRADWRVLINGTFDRMLFEQGFLQHRDGEEFESLRARSLVPGRSSGAGFVKSK